MTDLSKLNVSLTKHGAHKLAILLDEFPADQILKKLWGSSTGDVQIDEAQAKKNLSVGRDGEIPIFWAEAKKQGKQTIDALVLLSIIFSHYELIRAMSNGQTGPFKGRINRSKTGLGGKAYTNFSHTLDQLGYSPRHSIQYVEYNLKKLFKIPGLHQLAREMLVSKLTRAGWDRKNSLEDETAKLQLHKALAISEDQFRNWLLTGQLDGSSELTDEDHEFFTSAPEVAAIKPFTFSAGHNEKTEGTVPVAASKKKITATLLHNQIQNQMYLYLVNLYGKKNVGTEVDTGFGTSIDVVRQTDDGQHHFYEIKTADTVKASIRQAIPQLLEYAFWPDAENAVKLTIVSPLPITDEAKIYLKKLRTKFKLPLHYQQFDLDKNELI